LRRSRLNLRARMASAGALGAIISTGASAMAMGDTSRMTRYAITLTVITVIMVSTLTIIATVENAPPVKQTNKL